jgi:DNA-binding GntR family transcriptional regulator
MSSPAKEMTMTAKTDAVMADIVRRIREGEYKPGAKLPSAAAMRDQYQVSQMTIRVAIDRLRGDGWVTGRPGAGVFVATDPPIGQPE